MFNKLFNKLPLFIIFELFIIILSEHPDPGALGVVARLRICWPHLSVKCQMLVLMLVILIFMIVIRILMIVIRIRILMIVIMILMVLIFMMMIPKGQSSVRWWFWWL